MGIAGGLWRVETRSRPRFLSQSRAVDGHSARTGGADTKTLEWADVCPQGMRTITKPLVYARQRVSQLPLRPYTPRRMCPELCPMRIQIAPEMAADRGTV